MKRISFCVSLILFFVTVSIYASDQKLSSAYEQELIQRVKGIFGSDDQTQKVLDSARPVCATPILVELFANFENLSPQAQKTLSAFVRQRPDSFWTDPRTYDSEAGYFKIHYVVSGKDSVFESSVDILPADGHPDYVNRCAEILDYVWKYELDTLSYGQPPSDGWHVPNGGDGKYDVYLTHMESGYLGFTYPEAYYIYPRATSYVVLRSDYSIYTQPPYSLWEDQYDGMKVTAAHEFFHAIQLGYDAKEYAGSCPGPDCKPYWMEMTAVWMEDMVYDEINDYVGYLEYFFHYPWLSLKTFSYNDLDKPRYFHAYASCVWPIYLSEKFGSEIIKDIWIRCGEIAGDNAFSATGEILASSGSSFDQAFQEFTIWNYFTYSRADTQAFYSEGNLFDPIFIYTTQNHGSGSYPLTVNTIPKPPENLGSNYVSFKTNTGVIGDLNVGFYGDSTATWEVSLIGYKPGNPPWFSQINLNGLQNATESVHDWHLYDRIIMIPAVTTQQDNSFNYAYTAYINRAPVLDSIGAKSVDEGQTLIFGVHATDRDNDSLILGAVGVPRNATFVDSGNGLGSFTFNPDYTQTGLYSVTFIASDGFLADSEVVKMTVRETANQAPVLDSIRARSVDEGQPLIFKVHATDPENDSLVLSSVDVPSNATFVDSGNSAGSFTFSPDYTQSGVYDVTFIASDGSIADSEVVEIIVNDVKEDIPSFFRLFQNYPNPFNATTQIPFTVNSPLLTENGRIHTTLKIYNILGQEIRVLVDEEKVPATYEVPWDGTDNSGIEVASGIYFYKLKAGRSTEIKKMLLVK